MNFLNYKKGILSALLAILLLALPVKAQERKGTIVGTAKDEANSALASALIEVQPLGRKAVTDNQGQFRITDLPAGEYTLSASYVGFAPFSTTVRVGAGQTANVDVVLKVASQSDQVIVTGERLQGEAEAINIERMSDDILQVLPAKVINSLPNTNVADAVGRLPSVSLERDEGEGKYVQIRGTEPRLSNVTINGVNVPSPEGVVRNIKLDAVPADLVERIEVFKTLSANQDADGIGGTVNLVTKTAGEKPTYSIGGQGGYTPIQGGRTLGGFDGTLGKRFGTEKKLGFLLGGTFDRNNRGIDDLEPTQAATTFNGQNVAYVSSEDLRSYSYYRTRYGFASGVDYNLKPGTSVYLKGLYSDFHDYGDTWVYTPNAGNTIKSVNGSQITFDNATDCAPLNAANPGSCNPGSTISGTDFPKYHATQVNYQGAASLARRYTAHSHFGTFELGVKIRDSHTTQNQNDLFYNFNSGNPIALSSIVGNYINPSYYDHSFQVGSLAYGPVSDYNKVTQAIMGNLGQFQFDPVTSATRSASAFFDADERVYAGYLQNVISIGKFRVQTGVRFEGTNTSFLTNQLTANVDAAGNPLPPTISPLRQSSSYVNVLPSIQVQYLLEKNTNLRANFSQGISRPNIGDLVPTTIVDPNASPKSVSTGNPNLKPTKANNYDLLVEHFFQPLGIVQAGFFYKQLSDPIYPTAFTITSGPEAGFLQTQSINGPNAHITGFEAAWEYRLSRLPGLIGGFGVSANYSYTASQVTFPAGFSGGRTDHPTLQRQAPNNWNFGLTYDKSRFSGRFAITHNDANLFQYAYQQNSTPNDPILGLKGPTGDIYLYAHTQFDVQGSYRFYKGLSFFAYGLNLSNEVFGFYQGSGIYPIQREYYHPTVAFGMRWSSAAE